MVSFNPLTVLNASSVAVVSNIMNDSPSSTNARHTERKKVLAAT